jgi:hypothetical protein
MSVCSDVCLNQDLGYYNEFFTEGVQKAKIEHNCGECKRTIDPGEQYEYARGKSDGSWFTAKTCLQCMLIRKALICGDYFYGMMWEDIREYVYPELKRVGLSECFAKIDSRVARNNLAEDFERWMKEREAGNATDIF